MRIGIFAASLAVRPGYEDIVSGHVQVPLQCARLLADCGNEVHVVTSEYDRSAALPSMLSDAVHLHQVPYASRRRDSLVSYIHAGAISPRLARIRTINSLIRLARQERFDIFHFFGAAGTANLAGLVRVGGSGCPVILTLNTGRLPKRSTFLRTALWRRIDRILTTTEYFRRQLVENHKVTAFLLRHGAIRTLRVNSSATVRRTRVLFWREASPLNGGDIGVEVFRRLAPQYPDVSFDFAVRPHRLQPQGVAELSRSLANIHLFTTPYSEGVSIEQLLAESICVVQPFRGFTIQPQLSILESMGAGATVVATDIESTREMIESGFNGVVVPPDDPDAMAAAVESLLRDRDRAASMGRQAAESAAKIWNWQSVASNLMNHYREVMH